LNSNELCVKTHVALMALTYTPLVPSGSGARTTDRYFTP